VPHRFLILSLFAFLLPVGCVKRIPAEAGPDRTLRAGQRLSLGTKSELPEGTTMLWTTSDGVSLRGDRVTHTWHVPGTYEVVVTVTDPDGQVRTDGARVEVTRPDMPEVFGRAVKAFLLFDRTAERLAEFPVFLERLLSSGRDANAVLASFNEALGFDPFDARSVEAAGVDPTGGIALAQIEKGDLHATALVVSVLDRDKALDNTRRVLAHVEEYTEQPCPDDRSVTQVHSKRTGNLIAAYTFFRGHLWIAFDLGDPSGTAACLAAIREDEEPGGLMAGEDYRMASGAREGRGAVHLFLSKRELSSSSKDPSTLTGEHKRIEREIAKRLEYFRADLDLTENGIRAGAWLGLSGREATVLARVFGARNAVPDFGALLPVGRHLVLKLSMDIPGLIQAILELGDQKKAWEQATRALDELTTLTGTRVRSDLIENLGDNYLVSARFKPEGVLELASGGGLRDMQRWLELVSIFQVREIRRFREALDAICDKGQWAEWIRSRKEAGGAIWEIGSGSFALTLVTAGPYAVVATGKQLAFETMARVDQPGKAPSGWPSGMGKKNQQVLFLDVGAFVREFKQTQAPKDNPSAAFVKAMILNTLGRIESFGTITLNAALTGEALALQLDLSIQ
jgi:hypothetical protein